MKKDKRKQQSIRQFMQQAFKRMTILFGSMLVLMSFLLGISAYHLQDVITHHIPVMQASWEAVSQNLVVQNSVYKLCLSSEYDLRQQYSKELSEADMALQKRLMVLRKKDNIDKSEINKVQQLLQKSLIYRNQAVLYCRQGDNASAVKLLQENYFDKMAQVEEALKMINQNINQEISQLEKYYRRQMFFLILCVGIMTVIVIKMAHDYSKKLALRLQQPICEIVKAMEEMAKGNLETTITYNKADELGELADQIKKTKEQLYGYIIHIVSVLDTLSKRDYAIESTMDYQGTFQPIGHSIDVIITSLNEMITETKEMTLVISSEVEEIHKVSTTLSKSSMSQSKAVKQLTSTIKNITAGVEENTQNAQHVREDILNMQEVLQCGNQQMIEMIEKMAEMMKTTHEIEKIIAMIESISKQTHLLAINATIEAVRSGTAGKGFAVLADEIGKLANQTKKAVSETKGLVTGCLTAVSESDGVTNKLSCTLAAIDETAGKILLHADGVANASQKQYMALQSFNCSIEGISQVIVDNNILAHTIEENGASVLEKATHLEKNIQSFKLRG